ncbi:hypothetical protein KIPB_002980 [Kipferlia bialata]|uniref:Carboxypeptidase regulatory-like domain-containing protein n=1 Tax=Kipferlia bialata TaxID=797122 RepID=A0A9K3CT96_9EUKA|nr:hypothetical protein KIPB_002980 [Kipferlia bialata]|eukprot:g2980.t1
MGGLRCIGLFVALALLLALSGSADAAESCEGVTERDVLEALYFTCGGPSWTRGEGWLTIPNHCYWEGVYCDKDGDVVGLSMADFGMTGTLPAELGCLPSVQFLSFHDNHMITPFIEEICQNTLLTFLDLSDARVIGSLPPCLCDMPYLETLNLSNNLLNAPLPECMGTSPALSSFRADCARVEGSLPASLLDGSVQDIEVRCNPSLECPSYSSISPDTVVMCGVDAECEEECLTGLDPTQCPIVIEIPFCGPYFLDIPPCDFFGIEGRVTEEGEPDQGIEGALVTVYPSDSLTPLAGTVTDADGYYTIDLTEYAGEYFQLRVEVTDPDYTTSTEFVDVPLCGTTIVDVELSPRTCPATLWVTVTEPCAGPLPGVEVYLSQCDKDIQTGVTDEWGQVGFVLGFIVPGDTVDISWCYPDHTSGIITWELLCGHNNVELELECVEAPYLKVDVSTAEPFPDAVSGATVTWTTLDPPLSESAVTDVYGSVLFSPLPEEVLGAEYTLTVEGIPGLPGFVYSDGVTYEFQCCAGAEVPLVIPCPTQSLCLSVTEDCCPDEYSQPIGDIEICVFDTVDTETPLACVITSADGPVCLDIVPDLLVYPLTEVLTLFIYDGVEYWNTVPLSCGENDAVFCVECERVLTGTVTDAAGAPLEGVEVAVDGTDPLVSTVTDEEGNYYLTGVPPGIVTVTFTPPPESEYGPVTYEVEVPVCGVVHLDVVLPCIDPASLLITALDPCGAPLSGITIALTLDGVTHTLQTQADGEVWFTDLIPGTYVVNWSSLGGIYGCGVITGEMGCGINYLTIEPPCIESTLTVQVFTGPPNAGPAVGATVTYITDDNLYTDTTTTDATGTASFVLPSGAQGQGFTLDVTDLPDGKPDFQTAGVFPCCGPLDITLEINCDAQKVCVNLSEDCGAAEPVYIGMVEISYYDVTDPDNPVFLDTTITDADGEETMESCLVLDLPPALDSVYIEYTYESTPNSATVPLVCGDTVVCLEPVCVPVFTGYVKDEDGNPLLGATVTVDTSPDPVSTMTDGNGNFAILGIPAGVYDVEVTPSAADSMYLGAIEREAVTFAECGPTFLNPVLPCILKTVCVFVAEDCGDDPVVYIPGITVFYYDDEDDLIGDTVTNDTGIPDDDSCLEIPAILDAVTVIYQTPDGILAEEVVPVECGETVECLTAPCIAIIVGEVFAEVGGTPVVDALVSLSTTPETTTTTDSNGFFELLDVPTGPWVLTVTPLPADGLSPASQMVDVEECEDIEVTFELPPACATQEVCVSLSDDCDGVDPMYEAGVPVFYYDVTDPEDPVYLDEILTDDQYPSANCLTIDTPVEDLEISIQYEVDGQQYEQLVTLECGDNPFCFDLCPQVVTGTVTDATDPFGPIEGAEVCIDTTPEQCVTSDANGDYTLCCVDPGTYDVTVTATGYDTPPAEEVTIGECDIQIVNLVMTPNEEMCECELPAEELLDQTDGSPLCGYTAELFCVTDNGDGTWTVQVKIVLDEKDMGCGLSHLTIATVDDNLTSDGTPVGCTDDDPINANNGDGQYLASINRVTFVNGFKLTPPCIINFEPDGGSTIVTFTTNALVDIIVMVKTGGGKVAHESIQYDLEACIVVDNPPIP